MEITIETIGDPVEIILHPGEAKFVEIYRQRSFGDRARTSISLPWSKLPHRMGSVVTPRRERTTVSASTWRRLTVGCADIERLVCELARYDAVNMTRDRYLEDAGFIATLALAEYDGAPGSRPSGHMLQLKAVRLKF